LIVAVPAALYLVAATPGGAGRVATSIYAFGLVGLFGASAAYHRVSWSATALRWARSLDHSMIFVLIAGTYTAFGVLVMDGLWRVVVLGVVWTGAVTGIALKLIRINGLPRLGSALYMTLGWAGVVAAPQILSRTDPPALALIAAGGVMYTVGAVVLLRRKPDPDPKVFGYHEVWHAFVVAASACHYLAIVLLARETI
jgi:hemolysin III